MKILGINIPDKKSKKVLDEEAFVKAAEKCGYNKLIGLKLRDALIVYAGEAEKITPTFLRKIPDDQIEEIKGIKAAGHKIVDCLRQL